MDNSSEYPYSLEEISDMLSKKLKPSRLMHCKSVAFTAAAIAMSRGVSDLKPFLYAGLLHDCAKYLYNQEFIEYCEANNIEYDEYEKNFPPLLHGKVGADLAKKEYGIKNEDILNAIRNHTDGRPNMTFLEEAIHLADHMEALRDFPSDPPLEVLRRLAFEDYNKAIYLMDKGIINYLEKKGAVVTPVSYETLNYYKEKVNGEEHE